MKFDELDAKMRIFETILDLCVLPGIYDKNTFSRKLRKFNSVPIGKKEELGCTGKNIKNLVDTIWLQEKQFQRRGGAFGEIWICR